MKPKLHPPQPLRLAEFAYILHNATGETRTERIAKAELLTAEVLEMRKQRASSKVVSIDDYRSDGPKFVVVPAGFKITKGKAQ